jgi:3-oxoacyl-[acyl-carrier protein] reductase
MKKFEGKTVIVTGGTRGIGRGICEAFLASGANVVATYAGNDQAADAFKQENEQYSNSLEIKKFDVTKTDQVKDFFTYIDDKYESIEVLVNNSGIRKDAMVALMDDDQWHNVIDVNLRGTFNMSREAIPRFMSKKFGRIINMSSIGGEIGLPGQSNYAASKAGQVAFSKSLSKEVAKKRITVNCVCPGFIDTELLDDLPDEQKKIYKQQVPIKRFGKVSEVAHAVLFLASEEASYITGSTIEVTGGL